MRRTVKSLRNIGSALEEISRAFTGDKATVTGTAKFPEDDSHLSKLQIRANVNETLLQVWSPHTFSTRFPSSWHSPQSSADTALLQEINDGYFASNFDAVAYELLNLSDDKRPEDLELLAEERTSILEVGDNS